MNLRGGRHLSATQVAKVCGVDLKTIHNWVDRGKLPALRTAGRHLRFWPVDVVDFLRTFELGLPEALRQLRLRVVVVDGDDATLAAARRALSRRFEVTTASSIVEGLVVVATLLPDVLVLGDVAPLDAASVAEGLAAAETTRHVRVVLRGDVARLRETVEARVAG